MKLFRSPFASISLLITTSLAVANDNNVDLSTIPPRDTVQLTIYNSEDLTLVRETRHITFSEGMNPLQFSWANTLIDPSSVELRFKTSAEKLDVLDTTFPHDKPQMLYWNVRSEMEGDAVVEITYFTSGITWSADYVCISDAGETQMSFEGFVRITNNSGEDYADAQVRLVVGEINLVEKIAELAHRGLISEGERAAYLGMQMRAKSFEDERARQEVYAGVAGRMAVADMAEEKQIIKEGLSEYFIYTIEGTETIAHTWSKRMRLFQGLEVPFDITYRYRPQEYGDQLVRLFIIRNIEENNLGETPLPDGAVRLFRENGRDGLSYLVAHHTKYVPIGQEIELNLGVDPEVIHEHVRLRSWRDNFWFRDTKGTKYFNQNDERQIEHNYPVAGWDDHDVWVERIRNYRDKAVNVEIRRTYPGHVEFISELDPILHDFQTPQFTVDVASGSERDFEYEVVTHQGINVKQNNVTLRKPQ